MGEVMYMPVEDWATLMADFERMKERIEAKLPLYGVWWVDGNMWHAPDDAVVFYTDNLLAAKAQATYTMCKYRMEYRVCIIGDDGRPVELDK
jgi:hypothetical protein